MRHAARVDDPRPRIVQQCEELVDIEKVARRH
jgi:hypothetical protein